MLQLQTEYDGKGLRFANCYNRVQRGGGDNLRIISPNVQFKVPAQIYAFEIQDVRGMQT